MIWKRLASTVYNFDTTVVDKKLEMQFKYFENISRGRGFEPPPGPELGGKEPISLLFNHLSGASTVSIPAQSRRSGTNVSPQTRSWLIVSPEGPQKIQKVYLLPSAPSIMPISHQYSIFTTSPGISNTVSPETVHEGCQPLQTRHQE
jgi:hypothetical protein